MSALTYEKLALQWSPKRERDHRFNVMATIFVAGLILIGVVISSVNLPKEQRHARTVVPERVAKFILQKAKPKPKPKPKPIPPAKIRLKPQRKHVDKKPLTKKQKKARVKAADSGLLALGNELSDLIDTKSINAMVGKRVKRSKAANKTAAVNTNVLTANVNKGSGGVSAADGPTITGKTVLSQEQRLAVRQAITTTDSGADKSHKHGYRGEGLRSEEEIAIVMDQNKGQLHNLYRRARRKNPGLKGKIVLAITILPSGQVSKIEIRSSELHDPQLEARIIARIKHFNFGARGVETVTVTYPIEFLPS